MVIFCVLLTAPSPRTARHCWPRPVLAGLGPVGETAPWRVDHPLGWTVTPLCSGIMRVGVEWAQARGRALPWSLPASWGAPGMPPDAALAVGTGRVCGLLASVCWHPASPAPRASVGLGGSPGLGSPARSASPLLLGGGTGSWEAAFHSQTRQGFSLSQTPRCSLSQTAWPPSTLALWLGSGLPSVTEPGFSSAAAWSLATRWPGRALEAGGLPWPLGGATPLGVGT